MSRCVCILRAGLSRLRWAAGMLMLVSLPMFAQLPVGTILGVVKDSSGGVVPQANVTVTSTDTNQFRTVATGDDGAFRFPGLATGHYTVKIEKVGFRTETQTGLTLEVAQEMVLNTSLQIGTSAQEVVVTGEVALVNTTSSSTGSLVNEEKAAELPLNGRNYVDLTTIQPGIQVNVLPLNSGAGLTGTFFSSNGLGTRSNNFTLDGASMVNQVGGGSASIAGTTLGVDGIKEYKVITHSFSAEYGQMMGSQVVMVSKGGSNQWSGDAFEFLRNRVLDARNFFDYGYKTPGAPRNPQFQRNNFGGSFGGPIKKDKTFVYGVYEGLREELGITVLDTVPTAGCHNLTVQTDGTYRFNSAADATNCGSGLSTATVVQPVIVPLLAQFPLPNVGTNQYTFPTKAPASVDYGQIRVDQVFSAADSFFSRYTIDNGNMINPSGNTALLASTVAYPQYSLSGTTRDQYLTLSEGHLFSQSVLNTARISYSRMRLEAHDIWNTTSLNPQGELIGSQYSLVAGKPLGTVTITGLTPFGLNTNWPVTRTMNVFTISDDVFYTHGKHAFKFGTLLNRDYSSYHVAWGGDGSITFPSMASFMIGSASNYTALTPYAGQTSVQDAFTYVWNTLGFYVQDDWRTTSRLTFNLGLRYEVMNSMHGLNGIQSYIPDMATSNTYALGSPLRNYTLGDWSPRLGFAWDITGNGKMALRGGAGIYYDIGNISGTLTTDTVGNPPFIAKGQIQNLPAPITLPITIPSAFGTNLQLVDHNLKQPTSFQYNLMLERQLPFQTALSVGYVGTRGIHLFDGLEGNPCIPTAVTNGVPSWANAGNATCPSGRSNPNFGSAIFFTTPSESWYNSLQVTVNKRISHGLELQGSYVWSHAIDDTTQFQNLADCLGTGMAVPLNYPGNMAVMLKGPSCSDVRNVFHLMALYHLPNLKTDAFTSKILNGWWIGSIFTAQGGYPFTPIISTNRSLSGNRAGANGDLPSIVTTAGTGVNQPGTSTPYSFVPYDPKTVIVGTPQEWFNPLMFDLAPVGTLGNAPRGLLRGPGLSNLDFSLNKDTALPFLGERTKLEFRVEMFNILNHANFSLPSGTIYSGKVADSGAMSETPTGASAALPTGTGGQITSTITTSRQIQLALKLVF